MQLAVSCNQKDPPFHLHHSKCLHCCFLATFSSLGSPVASLQQAEPFYSLSWKACQLHDSAWISPVTFFISINKLLPNGGNHFTYAYPISILPASGYHSSIAQSLTLSMGLFNSGPELLMIYFIFLFL